MLGGFVLRARNSPVFHVGWKVRYILGMLLLLAFLVVLTCVHLLALRNRINGETLNQYKQVLEQADTLMVSRLDQMALSLQRVDYYLQDGLMEKNHSLPNILWMPDVSQGAKSAKYPAREIDLSAAVPQASSQPFFRLNGHDEIAGCYVRIRGYGPGQLALIGVKTDSSLGVARFARSASGATGYHVMLPKNGELLLDDLRRMRPDINIKSFSADFESCGLKSGLARRVVESTWYGLYLKVSGSQKLPSLPVWLDYEVESGAEAADLWERELFLCFLGLFGIFLSMVFMLLRLEKWVGIWNLNIYKIKQEQDFLQVAQRLANVGSFQLNMNSGRMIWSDHMYVILEIERSKDGFEPTPDLLYATVHPDDIAKVRSFFAIFGRALAENEVDEKIEFRWLGENGQIKYLVASALHGIHEKSLSGWFCGILQDVTESQNIRDEIYKLATTDSLTGLPNRTYLTTKVEEILSEAKKSQSSLAFVYIDLDNFKDVNDAFGHSFGDMLLLEVAARLKLKMLDGDFICRQGGDEFLIILKNAAPEAVHLQAEMLLAISANPFTVMGREISVFMSMGIAIFPDDGGYYDSIQRKADIAMYEAKRSGRNAYVCYSPSIPNQSERNIFIVNSFRKALELDQFYLEYQPIINAVNGKIVSFEVLLRWQHPEVGLISPAEFIPLAEQSGFILQLGHWTLRQAILQLKIWLDAGYADIVLAVNISTLQLVRSSFPEEVLSLLSRYNVPNRYLEIEITESAAMANPDVAMQTVKELKLSHVGVSVDDFGTGYSSLSYLKRFEISRLKIDRSFVKEIAHHADDRSIVGAILDMTKHLGIEVIAEGVETWEQFEILSALQCRVMQGYLFSRSLSSEAAGQLLDHMSRDSDWRLQKIPLLVH